MSPSIEGIAAPGKTLVYVNRFVPHRLALGTARSRYRFRYRDIKSLLSNHCGNGVRFTLPINSAPKKKSNDDNKLDSVSPMSNIDFLARAYALADTGKFATVTEIRKALTNEGFSLWQISQLAGKELQSRLRERIAAARSTHLQKAMASNKADEDR